MKDFLIYIGGTLVVALVLAGCLVFVYPAFLAIKENEEAVVGLFALITTLPVTLAASIVVIKLGDRMDRLAQQADARERFQDVRERFQIGREMFDETFEQLRALASQLNYTKTEVQNILVAMMSEFNEYRSMSAEGQVAWLDNRETVADGGVGGQRPIAFCEDYAHRLLRAHVAIRQDFSKSIDEFLAHCWSIKPKSEKNQAGAFRIAIDAFKKQLEQDEAEMSDLIKSAQKESWRAAFEKNKKIIEQSTLGLKTLESSIASYAIGQKDNPLIIALAQLKAVIAFSKEKELTRHTLEIILQKCLDGELSSEDSFELLLGLVVCPVELSKLPPEYYDGYQIRHDQSKIIKNMSDGINQLGFYAIKDLLLAWPKREDIVDHMKKILVPDSVDESVDKEVRKKLDQMMGLLKDPQELVSSWKF